MLCVCLWILSYRLFLAHSSLSSSGDSALYSSLQHTETFRLKHRQKMGDLLCVASVGHGLVNTWDVRWNKGTVHTFVEMKRICLESEETSQTVHRLTCLYLSLCSYSLCTHSVPPRIRNVRFSARIGQTVGTLGPFFFSFFTNHRNLILNEVKNQFSIKQKSSIKLSKLPCNFIKSDFVPPEHGQCKSGAK